MPTMLALRRNIDGYLGIKPAVLELTEITGKALFTTNQDEKPWGPSSE